MVHRRIIFFICISMAIARATDYGDQGVVTGSDHEVTTHYLSTDSTGSSTTESAEGVEDTTTPDLGALLDAGEGAMVTLEAGDTRLVAHRAVLAARSPVLAAMLHHDKLKASSGHVSLTDVEGRVLRQLLAYLYTLQAPQLPGMAPQLLVAADRYGLSGLKAACEQQVAGRLTVENAAATALLALRHFCPSLRQAAVAFIKAHTQQVVMTQGWADAVVGNPHSAVELTRLLAETPAETSAPASSAPSQQHSHHSQATSAAAPPTATCHAPPPDEGTVSRMRNLSTEEKGRRLLKAAKMGAVEELQALLAAGADMDARDVAWNNWTALHWAADRGHLEAVRCLVEAGAEARATTSEQNTALHLAAWSGHAAVVRQLLGSSVDPNIRGEGGSTPLHFAARWGNTKAAFVLLEAGADSKIKANTGWTPDFIAGFYGQHHLVQILSPR